MSSLLLVSPLARRAYFAETVEVAISELQAVAGMQARATSHSGLDFLEVDGAVPADSSTARLSFLQALFEGGLASSLNLRNLDPLWHLPEPFTHGSSYQGKTNETVTQLAINLALAHCQARGGEAHSLLDPMAGQGTTLLWTV